jgi:hypothetical protein
MREKPVQSEVRDLRIPHGCVVCGGDLAIRVTPSGARAYCRQCLRLSTPLLVPGPTGPQVVELAAAA